MQNDGCRAVLGKLSTEQQTAVHQQFADHWYRAMGRESTPANGWSGESLRARDRPETMSGTQRIKVSALSLHFKITPVGSRPCVQRGYPYHRCQCWLLHWPQGLPLTSTFSTMTPNLTSPPSPRHTHLPFVFVLILPHLRSF